MLFLAPPPYQQQHKRFSPGSYCFFLLICGKQNKSAFIKTGLSQSALLSDRGQKCGIKPEQERKDKDVLIVRVLLNLSDAESLFFFFFLVVCSFWDLTGFSWRGLTCLLSSGIYTSKRETTSGNGHLLFHLKYELWSDSYTKTEKKATIYEKLKEDGRQVSGWSERLQRQNSQPSLWFLFFSLTLQRWKASSRIVVYIFYTCI